jgi:BRCA1-A complex subunit BRE
MSLAPHVLDYLRALHGFMSVKVSDFRKSNDLNDYCDRFTLHVPYCGVSILWDVYFDVSRPKYAPEIVFMQHDDLFVDWTSLYAINKWNDLGSSAFYQLVKELLSLYDHYFGAYVRDIDNQIINFEYNTIQGINGVRYWTKNEKTETEVRFLIPLDVVGYEKFKENTQTVDSIDLMVTFNLKIPTKEISCSTKLIMSETLRQWVGNIQTPKWKIGSTCLIEYIPAIQNTISKILEQNYLSIDRRRDFIKVLSSRFGTPVEFDSVNFEKAAFLMSLHFENGLFLYLVHFTIPINFPQGAPIVYLQSTQHIKEVRNGKQLIRAKLQYTYDPDWKFEQLVEEIHDQLQIMDKQFYEMCLN